MCVFPFMPPLPSCDLVNIFHAAKRANDFHSLTKSRFPLPRHVRCACTFQITSKSIYSSFLLVQTGLRQLEDIGGPGRRHHFSLHTSKLWLAIRNPMEGRVFRNTLIRVLIDSSRFMQPAQYFDSFFSPNSSCPHTRCNSPLEFVIPSA